MRNNSPRTLWLAVVAALLWSFTSLAGDAKAIRVALYNDEGAAGKGVPRLAEILTRAGGYEIQLFMAPDLPGALQDKDVVIFTGGSGSKQGNAIGEAGRAEVQRFVREGGGYVGICAGAYLACSRFSWGLGLLNAETVSSKWQRGVGDVQFESTPAGEKLMQLPAQVSDIRYANGPIIKPAGRTDLPPYEPLALFRTELAKNGTPVGVMVNSPAMAKGEFGKGRVIISSPHPEQTPGLDDAVERAVRWVARGTTP